MKQFTNSQLISVANACYANFHKDICAPVDLFQVHESHDGFVYLLPDHFHGMVYFSSDTITFIVHFLNNKGIPFRVVDLYGSVAIKLLHRE